MTRPRDQKAITVGFKVSKYMIAKGARTIFPAIIFFELTALGQGLVGFTNLRLDVGLRAPIYDDFEVPLSGTNQLYRAVLLGGPVGSTPACGGRLTNGVPCGCSDACLGTLGTLASPVSGATWVTFRTGGAAGFVGIGTDAMRLVPGVSYGGTAMVQIPAWEGHYTNWDDAFNHFMHGSGRAIGVSNPVYVPVTTNAADINLQPLIGLQSFGISEGLISDGTPGGFFSRPVDQSAYPGATVTLQSDTKGQSPQTRRQWQFNGVDIAGATDDWLTIPGFRPTNAGAYRIIVTNYLGGDSATVMLTINGLKLNAEGFNSNVFQLTLAGDPTVKYRAQGSPNLVQWTDLGLFTQQAGVLRFNDPPTNFTRRFYRAVLP
jgi:hypothetical protein